MFATKAELQYAIYTCGKRKHFQSQLGQTKVVFNNRSKNASQCVAFWLEIFLFKIEIAFGKKLKLDVATNLWCFLFCSRKENWMEQKSHLMFFQLLIFFVFKLFFLSLFVKKYKFSEQDFSFFEKKSLWERL